MSLREQVARRLWHQHFFPDHNEFHADLWDKQAVGAHEAWLRAADEVIRLMEWARRPQESVSTGLTLPPDGWQP